MTEENDIVIEVKDVIDLDVNSRIVIKTANKSFYLKPVTVAIYSQYQKDLETMSVMDAKAHLVSRCLTKPKMKPETLLNEQTIGMVALLHKHLTEVSFLQPSVSSE